MLQRVLGESGDLMTEEGKHHQGGCRQTGVSAQTHTQGTLRESLSIKTKTHANHNLLLYSSNALPSGHTSPSPPLPAPYPGTAAAGGPHQGSQGTWATAADQPEVCPSLQEDPGPGGRKRSLSGTLIILRGPCWQQTPR